MKPAGAEVVNCTKFLITRRPLVGGVKNCQSSQDIDKKSLLLVSLIVDLISIGHKLPIFFTINIKGNLRQALVSGWLFTLKTSSHFQIRKTPSIIESQLCLELPSV